MTNSQELDPLLPESFTLDEALAAGMTIEQVRYRLDSGRWEFVGRGSYRRADWAAPEDDVFERRRRDHTHRAIAAGRRNRDAILGYESAALIHGLPLWSPPPDYVTLIVAPSAWNGRRNRLVLRQLDVPTEDVLAHDVPMTTPARTWVDIARTRDLADALAAGDAGLRAGLFSKDELWAALRRAEGSRGCARAAYAWKQLDAVRESPGESASWAYFVAHGLELPRCQVELRGSADCFVARVDFRWCSRRVVGEFDGRSKYADAADLYEEKRREDEIRSLGEQVVRWGADDLRGPSLARRLRDLLES